MNKKNRIGEVRKRHRVVNDALRLLGRNSMVDVLHALELCRRQKDISKMRLIEAWIAKPGYHFNRELGASFDTLCHIQRIKPQRLRTLLGVGKSDSATRLMAVGLAKIIFDLVVEKARELPPEVKKAFPPASVRGNIRLAA